ncbi:hypothetical protein WJX73_002747 [Symbiochloris irregularis]|uniref:F-box domain-containing protein n=1 Tax=Symbiochloris irregularis TaxID=706552 RepID=A0AAW1NSI6_9CHLO
MSKLLEYVVGVLEREFLPLLSAKDYGSLACVSKDINELISQSSGSTWEAASRQILGKAHPLSKRATRREVQMALQMHAEVLRNAKAGKLKTFLVTAPPAIHTSPHKSSGARVALVDCSLTGAMTRSFSDMGILLHPLKDCTLPGFAPAAP